MAICIRSSIHPSVCWSIKKDQHLSSPLISFSPNISPTIANLRTKFKPLPPRLAADATHSRWRAQNTNLIPTKFEPLSSRPAADATRSRWITQNAILIRTKFESLLPQPAADATRNRLRAQNDGVAAATTAHTVSSEDPLHYSRCHLHVTTTLTVRLPVSTDFFSSFRLSIVML
ncbi:hypothetical protein DEO72_LG10g2050 [Vigna unguiculata]|uniref:Uncharacterized protein n=1 Tax=Vigna unguiculata TaxID=3917 RepID=A0A4D6NBW7_VIGUN|nr:hypothetical protein DEO72_LG10g2050 [Vigna unguiculata]